MLPLFCRFGSKKRCIAVLDVRLKTIWNFPTEWQQGAQVFGPIRKKATSCSTRGLFHLLKASEKRRFLPDWEKEFWNFRVLPFTLRSGKFLEKQTPSFNYEEEYGGSCMGSALFPLLTCTLAYPDMKITSTLPYGVPIRYYLYILSVVGWELRAERCNSFSIINRQEHIRAVQGGLHWNSP